MNILQSATTKLGNRIELIGTPTENNVLIIGVFHGDEPQGKYLIEKYLSLHTLPRGGRVRERGKLFVPCLNPDGLQNATRTNANGVDLNRNFPTKNWGDGVNVATEGCSECQDSSLYYGGTSPASEIETLFVIDIIKKYQPKTILTLHAPYKIVNYDGPAQDIAQKISDIIGYPVEESIGYPTPGSFGTYCGVERNIPTITLELDEKIPIENLVQPVFKIFDIL